jgi:hypothetical protein
MRYGLHVYHALAMTAHFEHGDLGMSHGPLPREVNTLS